MIFNHKKIHKEDQMKFEWWILRALGIERFVWALF